MQVPISSKFLSARSALAGRRLEMLLQSLHFRQAAKQASLKRLQKEAACEYSLQRCSRREMLLLDLALPSQGNKRAGLRASQQSLIIRIYMRSLAI